MTDALVLQKNRQCNYRHTRKTLITDD